MERRPSADDEAEPPIPGRSPRPARHAVVAFDPEGRVRAANEAAWEMLDVSSGSLEGMLGPLATSAVGTAGTGDLVESAELQLRTMPDRWLELTIVDGADDEVSHYIIVRDITPTRRDKTLREIIPTLLSHELRTPMTSIYAAAQILRAQTDRLLDEERLTLFDDVAAEMWRLRLLLDDLVVLCQDDGSLGVRPQPELMHHILPELITTQCRRWKDRDIELRIHGEPGIVAVDRHALDHVMSDLILNAAVRGGDAPIEVTLRKHPRGGAVVAVADGGPGYRQQEQLLLRPIGFAQLRHESSGTAISLHVAYRLVAAMSGSMWARTHRAGGEVGFWLQALQHVQ